MCKWSFIYLLYLHLNMGFVTYSNVIVGGDHVFKVLVSESTTFLLSLKRSLFQDQSVLQPPQISDLSEIIITVIGYNRYC